MFCTVIGTQLSEHCANLIGCLQLGIPVLQFPVLYHQLVLFLLQSVSSGVLHLIVTNTCTSPQLFHLLLQSVGSGTLIVEVANSFLQIFILRQTHIHPLQPTIKWQLHKHTCTSALSMVASSCIAFNVSILSCIT